MRPRILVEGRPGAGKTTAVRRLVDILDDAGVSVDGFLTHEIRERGRRTGFEIEGVDGTRGILAAVGMRSDVRVGRYGVDVEALERIALPALRRGGDVVVVDELGKMELASQAFTNAVQELFEQPIAIVATVHAFSHPITDALKKRGDVDVIRVTTRERDRLPEQIAERLGVTN